jgi:hypothetical protein
MRIMARRLQALVMMVALAACAPAASQNPGPNGSATPVAQLPEVPEPVVGEGMVEDAGIIVRPVQPQWTPGSGGIGMSDDWGEHPVILEPPVPVSVLAGPIGVDGGEWYQVYVLPDAMRWPSDFVAWVPAEQDGASVLEVGEPAPCPDATAGHLAALTPKARADCFGDRILTFMARSWMVGHWVPYETEPDWLGTTVGDVRSVSLYESVGEFPRPPDPRVQWLDARVPPGLRMPPAGMTLLVEGRFDDPQAQRCARTRDRSGPPRQPPTAGLPDEDPEASDTWCRGQFVLQSWEIILGPEGIPPVIGEVQLHRTAFEGGECAGVGMSLLRFHMDVTAPDPIWLEAIGQPGRAIPVFGRAFRAETEPELHIVGPRGDVVATHGTILDPDAPLGPYAVCPMGETVSITGT